LLAKSIREIEKARLWDERIPEMINAYFVDLDRVVARCARCLKAGAVAGFVVAESTYGGIVIPVHTILTEILGRRGFEAKNPMFLRNGLGNGHHQQRSDKKLKEVMVVAAYYA